MSRTYRILVIDDEPMYHKMIEHALKPLGYELDFATNGVTALQTAFSKHPDAIITDVVMEDMTGYEVTQQLRRNSKFAHTPIIVLTSQIELGDKLQAFESGADDYMSKPFEPKELAARLSVLLRRVEITESVQPDEERQEQARVIAFHSLRGGVGCSSLAINTAAALWELWKKPTLLVDTVLTAGQVALMVNMSLRRTWADIAELKPDQIDYELLSTIISKHKSGLHIIAAPTSPADAEMITGATLKIAVEHLKPQYDYIIIDTPHDFSETTINMLDVADDIVMMMAPEMASIRAAVSAKNTYEQLGYSDFKTTVLLNRIFESSGLDQSQIEKALGAHIQLTIPFAGDTFIKAINLGEPVVYSDSKSHVANVLESFAYTISKDEHQQEQPLEPTSTWQRISKRFAKR